MNVQDRLQYGISGIDHDSVTWLPSSIVFMRARVHHGPSGRECLLLVARQDVPKSADQLAEIDGLLRVLNDAHVGQVIERGVESSTHLDYLLMTWHENAVSLDRAVIKARAAGEELELLDTILQVMRQVHAMHEAGFVHGDLSLSNVLIGPRGDAHVIDLEFVTRTKFRFEATAFHTDGYSHPDRLAHLVSGRYRWHEAKAWDLYALGQLILQLLSDADPYRFVELSLFNQRGLRMIALLLLGEAVGSASALGLPAEFFRDEAYSSLSPAIDAMERLLGQFGVEARVPELAPVQASVVEAGLGVAVPFTARVRALVETEEMQTLHSSLQLGLINYIWPGATHVRFEHAVGTFGLTVAAVVNLYADPQSPIFLVLADPERVRTLLCAALLHDVGHYPLAHDLEEAYPSVFHHESRSMRFIQRAPLRDLLERPESDPRGWGVRSMNVASLISGRREPDATFSIWTIELLHSVISGSLDVDKLDYLVRDSRALGVAAGGGIDVRRVLSSLTIVLIPAVARGGVSHRPERARLTLGVRAKGIRPAELVGRIRSHMFGVVYWHHSYRAIKSMIHWIVWSAVATPNSASSDFPQRAALLANRLFSLVDVPSIAADGQTLALPGLENPRDLTQRSKRSVRELDVLNYFSGASVAANEMIDLLSRKRWYHAVLTVEHYQNDAVTSGQVDSRRKALWTRLESIQRRLQRAPQRLMLFRMLLSTEYQRLLLEWLKPKNEGKVRTRVLDWTDQRDALLLASVQGQQLVLIDVMDAGKSSDSPLYFAPSERAGSRLTSAALPIPARRSYDQSQLSDEFVASNGAIRVFCHPQFQEFVTNTVPEADLFDLLVHAVDAAKNAVEGRGK